MNPSIHNPSPDITLTDIETHARKLREARDAVAVIVTDLNTQIAELQANATRRLRSAINRTAEQHSALRNMVDANRHLFLKPRTQTFHGIKLGIVKGKGKLDFDSAEDVIAAIKKKLHPDLLDVMAPAKRKLSLNALKTLSVAELQSIGCTVEETGDYVFVGYTDKEVDKLVNALLRAATEDAQQEAA